MMVFEKVAKKIFGTQNDRELKTIQPIVVRINELESKIKPLNDAQLQAKTQEFRERLSRGEALDAVLPEAFAVMREAAWRVIGQRHYDVQLIGGTVLHRGKIAEMRTGEGKTLVATLPAYLNALSGKGVHIVTVNDYLARRDSEWMGRIHRFLGLSTGIIVHGLTDAERKHNYGCDITYGTNNEFGFDYLRDNMKFRLDDYVQRELNYAIIDEVDSILIDEARTPLIISGPSDDATDLYYKIDEKIRADGGLIRETDYTIDEKSKTAALTEAGVDKMEKRLGIVNLYDPSNIEVLHHVNQGLRAHVLFKLDVDYVIQGGEIMIVDEFTGRLMPGRRWSDGLHQAIEAKEGVTIENENQTLATITFQNYFRMYNKLSGMTGTADTEANEFKQIYKLDVVVIPTNRDMVRKDESDIIYKTEEKKFISISEEVKKMHEKGQPILIGTVSVEKSELLSRLLNKDGIKHHVLNAKQHEREAEIIAQAGRKGAVTIATNMAGRGTDILLGGNPEFMAKREAGTVAKDATPEQVQEHEAKVKAAVATWDALCAKEREEVKTAGGLVIVGTERHESRRIDNQLRGRAGRQGDPGGSRFFLSLDDDLMRIFGGTNIKRFMEDDVPIEHRWINKAIENAQRKVEAHNYDIRKHLLEYDDVMNQQRKIIYAWRREVLARKEYQEMLFSMVDELAEAIANDFFPGGKPRRGDGQSTLDMGEINSAVTVTLQIPSAITENQIVPYNHIGLKKKIMEQAHQTYQEKESQLSPETFADIQRWIFLSTIDHLWKEHLLAMDHLREGIGLQGYGQKDPLVEYKKGGYNYFQMMMGLITGDVVRKAFAVQLSPDQVFQEEPRELPSQQMQYNLNADGSLKGATGLPGPAGAPAVAGPQSAPARTAPAPVAQAVSSGLPKVGRNDLCPCGSGKKYKKCHGS